MSNERTFARRVEVECYSGHTYAQEPRAVVWEGRRYIVTEVEARWRTPDGPAFHVRTEPEESFELHYHELEDTWSVRLLRSRATRSPERG
jgi:hypothetical protein